MSDLRSLIGSSPMVSVRRRHLPSTPPITRTAYAPPIFSDMHVWPDKFEEKCFASRAMINRPPLPTIP